MSDDEKVGTPEDFAALFRTQAPEPQESEELEMSTVVDNHDQAESEWTDDQRIGYAIQESLAPGAKEAANEALIASIHGRDPEVSDGFDGGAAGRGIAPRHEPPTIEEIERDHGNWIVDTFPHRDSVA